MNKEFKDQMAEALNKIKVIPWRAIIEKHFNGLNCTITNDDEIVNENGVKIGKYLGCEFTPPTGLKVNVKSYTGVEAVQFKIKAREENERQSKTE